MSAWTGRVCVGGKLMLAGEYSVLGPGGTAVSVAVSPGLTVRVEDAQQWSVAREDMSVSWAFGDAKIPEPLRFAVESLLAVLDRYGTPQMSPARLTFEAVHAYGSGETKPGVGGSASATVAAMAATYRRLGLELAVEDLVDLGIAVHRDAQGGRGSGYDVATIAHGGLVVYRPRSLSGEIVVESERITWPDGMRLVAGYTGQSASTTALLGRLEARHHEAPDETAAAIRALAAPVPDLVAALRVGGFDAVCTALASCQEALERFDAECGIGIITPAVAQMIDAAMGVGAACKVSGAGGGDSVAALAPNEDVADAVERAWTNAGYQVLPVEISTQHPFREMK